MPKKNIDYLSQNAFSKLANQKKYEIKMGLFNFKGSLSNVCFMNSVFQVLLNIPELTLYFLSKQYDKDKKVSDGVADAYRDLLLNIINNSDENVRLKSLEKLKDAMGNFDQKFKDGSQQDADEFLSDFFTCISEELNSSFSFDKEYGTLAQQFGQDSNIASKFKKKEKRCTNKRNLFLTSLLFFCKMCIDFCKECGSCLVCQFALNNELRLYDNSNSNYKFLYDGLKLGEVNNLHYKDFCNKCNKEIEVYTRCNPINLPNYLFLFRGATPQERRSIEFQADDFSLGDLVINREDQDTKYDLVSVVCYVNGNHYITYSKKSDGWYLFDDSTVQKMPDDFKINEDKSIKNNFFYLVYKKKDIRDKDLFDGYDINDFVHDEEDLKIISELSEKEEIKNKELPANHIENNNNDLTQKPGQTFEPAVDDNKNPELSEKEKVKNKELPANHIENNNNNNDDDDLTQKPGRIFEPAVDDNKNHEDKKNKSLGKEIFKSFGVWSLSLVTVAGVPVGITTTFVLGIVTSSVGGTALLTLVIIKIILFKKQMKKIKSDNEKENNKRPIEKNVR